MQCIKIRVNRESKFPDRFSSEKCFPIRIDGGDNFFRGRNKECMEFSRSLSSPDLSCNVKQREQLNQVGAWDFETIACTEIYQEPGKVEGWAL